MRCVFFSTCHSSGADAFAQVESFKQWVLLFVDVDVPDIQIYDKTDVDEYRDDIDDMGSKDLDLLHHIYQGLGSWKKMHMNSHINFACEC